MRRRTQFTLVFAVLFAGWALDLATTAAVSTQPAYTEIRTYTTAQGGNGTSPITYYPTEANMQALSNPFPALAVWAALAALIAALPNGPRWILLRIALIAFFAGLAWFQVPHNVAVYFSFPN